MENKNCLIASEGRNDPVNVYKFDGTKDDLARVVALAIYGDNKNETMNQYSEEIWGFVKALAEDNEYEFEDGLLRLGFIVQR